MANLTTNAGPINVDVRDETFAENVTFQATTNFETVEPGEALVAITPFGEPDNVLFESDGFNFLSGNFLTLVAAGTDETNTARLIGNDRRRIPTRASLTVTNAALSGGTVDL
ncbi:MAG: DUF4397 domain-containing protein [Gammaproteobacteria bacterium]|nr:DUF4397 domain-containing protein [Gammaproteobacteria bacterium]